MVAYHVRDLVGTQHLVLKESTVMHRHKNNAREVCLLLCEGGRDIVGYVGGDPGVLL